MTTILDQLAAAESAANETAHEDYRLLVEALAAGTNDPQLTDVQRVLAAVGKNANDLETAVRRRRDRWDKQARIRECESIAARSPELLARISKESAEFTKQRELHDQKLRQLQNELDDARRASIEKAELESDLRRFPTRELEIEMNNTRDLLEALDHTVSEARRKAETAKSSLSQNQARGSLDPESIAYRKSQIEIYEREHSQLVGRQSDLLRKQQEIINQQIWG